MFEFKPNTHYWIGIDPGSKGAMCILSNDNSVYFVDYKDIGIKLYKEELSTSSESILHVGVEKVNAMPGQGVKSMFTFGHKLGEIEGLLTGLGIGYQLVRPQEWQRACGIKLKSGKKGIYEVMSKIYPNASLLGTRNGIIDGRCDALGIAHYMRMKYRG